MRRLLLGLLLGALIFGVSFAGAKLSTVTNPMNSDLDGGQYSITNLTKFTAALGEVDVVMQLGNNQAGHTVRGTLTMGDGTTGEGVEILAGYEDPSVAAYHMPPGTLFLRHAPGEHGELWFQECADATPCWVKIAG